MKKAVFIFLAATHAVVGVPHKQPHPPSVQEQEMIRVGAKHFNEGYILSEMIALVLEDGGFEVERKFNLGGTTICFEALKN